MTGDNNGRWGGHYSWPINHDVYIKNANDTVKALRSHASLALWVLGNELYPAVENPPPDIYNAMASILDAEETPWRVSSMTNASGYDWTVSMAPKDGPYGMLGDRQFSERNPGLYFWNASKLVRATNLSISFQPELGASSCPTFESLKTFLSSAHLAQYPRRPRDNISAPVDVGEAWLYHNYLPWTLSDSHKDTIEEIGQSIPSTVRVFSARAQLVQKGNPNYYLRVSSDICGNSTQACCIGRAKALGRRSVEDSIRMICSLLGLLRCYRCSKTAAVITAEHCSYSSASFRSQ